MNAFPPDECLPTRWMPSHQMNAFPPNECLPTRWMPSDQMNAFPPVTHYQSGISREGLETGICLHHGVDFLVSKFRVECGVAGIIPKRLRGKSRIFWPNGPEKNIRVIQRRVTRSLLYIGCVGSLSSVHVNRSSNSRPGLSLCEVIRRNIHVSDQPSTSSAHWCMYPVVVTVNVQEIKTQTQHAMTTCRIGSLLCMENSGWFL